VNQQLQINEIGILPMQDRAYCRSDSSAFSP
jgi:hypothetical protein